MAAGRRRPQTPAAAHEQQVRAVQERRQQAATVRDLLGRYEQKLLAVLPKLVTPERLIELVMTSVARTPDLLECTQASLVGAVITAGQLGLLPGVNGECWILPYRNRRENRTEAQLVPGYRGLLKLAYNTREIAMVHCSVVRQGDTFDFRYGTSQFLNHRPVDDSTAPFTHAYAVVQLKGSEHAMFDVMDRERVMRAKASSPAASSSYSPWATWEDEMWMKTALRHICKRLPTSIEKLGMATTLAEQGDTGIAQNLGTVAPDLPELPVSAGVQIGTGPAREQSLPAGDGDGAIDVPRTTERTPEGGSDGA